jgi:hypothetical protein
MDTMDDIDIYLNLDEEPPDIREACRPSRMSGYSQKHELPTRGRISNFTFKSPLRLLIKVKVFINIDCFRF